MQYKQDLPTTTPITNLAYYPELDIDTNTLKALEDAFHHHNMILSHLTVDQLETQYKH